MTKSTIAPHHLARIKALPIQDKVVLYEWCEEVFSVGSKFANQPRCDDRVEHLGDELLSDVAGTIMEHLIDFLSEDTPKEERDADAMAQILIPYHINNENLVRAGQELSRLLYLTSRAKFDKAA